MTIKIPRNYAFASLLLSFCVFSLVLDIASKQPGTTDITYLNKAIRTSRQKRGWRCGKCGALVSLRCTAEQHCEQERINEI